MFKKHPYLFAILIGILLVLNLWKWLPSALHPGGPARRGLDNGELTLAFPDKLEEGERAVRRNLFEAGSFAATRPSAKRISPAPNTLKIQPTPTAASNDLSADGSVSQAAGGYRLLGIASREGQTQALIGKGDQLFQVGQGGDIEGKYEVQAITQSEVYLTEKQSGNTLKLRIWDKPGGSP